MNDLKLLAKYRNQFIAACCLVGAFVILMQVILPNFTSITAQQQKNAQEEEKLREINLSAQIIQSSNQQELENNLTLTVRALPPEKDITGIYSALTNVSAKSGIFFDGFTVSVGGIYSRGEEEEEEAVVATPIGVPSVPVTVKIGNANKENIANFLNNLLTAVPISDVKDMTVSEGSGDVQILFFYKPYDLSRINQEIAKPFTAQGNEILKSLSTQN